MTNLQILLSKLDLTEKDRQQAIIDNFYNQDEKEFIINDEIYKILSLAEAEDEFFERVENNFLELEDYILNSEYSYLVPYIDFDRAAAQKTEAAVKNKESIEEYTFIGECNYNYIYLVE